MFLAAEAPQTFNNKHRGGVGERELGSQMGPWPDTKAGTLEEGQLNLKLGFAILSSDWACCRGWGLRRLPRAPAFGFCGNFSLQRMKTRGWKVQTEARAGAWDGGCVHCPYSSGKTEKPNKLKGGDEWTGKECGAGPLGQSTLGLVGSGRCLLPGRPRVGGGKGPTSPSVLWARAWAQGRLSSRDRGVLWPQVLGGAASSPP